MKTTVHLLADNLAFPEGPAFAPDGSLWCVELEGGNIVHIIDESIKRYPTGGNPNGLIFDLAGYGWICDAGNNKILKFFPETGAFETKAEFIDGKSLNKPNDLIFDAHDSTLFTCPGNSRAEPTGYVCCRDSEGAVKKIADNLYFPNGLVLSDEGETLIIAETFKQRLWKGYWSAEKQEWTDAKVWADTGGSIGPDGMALDANGLLYVAVYGSGQIKVIDTAGDIVQAYDLPGSNPTNVAFDPSGRLGLIVTEAEKGQLLSLPEVKFDGSGMEVDL